MYQKYFSFRIEKEKKRKTKHILQKRLKIANNYNLSVFVLHQLYQVCSNLIYCYQRFPYTPYPSYRVNPRWKACFNCSPWDYKSACIGREHCISLKISCSMINEHVSAGAVLSGNSLSVGINGSGYEQALGLGLLFTL